MYEKIFLLSFVELYVKFVKLLSFTITKLYLCSGGGNVQIGVCDDQKEIRELIMDKVREFYPAGDVIPYASGREVLDAMRLPDI